MPKAEHGTFDYIVSSHNFEHLPDPLAFLGGCERLLAPGGILAMAVPDARAIWDRFRPPTRIAEWIEANLEGRARPSLRQLFEQDAARARVTGRAGEAAAYRPGMPLDRWRIIGDLRSEERLWRERSAAADTGYHDMHCTVMSPASLELLMTEAQILGHITMRIDSITPGKGIEFYVRLVNDRGGDRAGLSTEEGNVLRSALMRRAIIEWRDGGLTQPLRFAWDIGPRRVGRALRDLGRRLRSKSD